MLERIKSLYFSHCSKRFWPRTNLTHSPVACDSASPGSARALAGLQLDCSIHLCWQGSPTKQCRCQGYAVAGAELVTGSCHCGLLVFEFASRPGTRASVAQAGSGQQHAGPLSLQPLPITDHNCRAYGACWRGFSPFPRTSSLSAQGTESRLHRRGSPQDRNQVQTRTSTVLARRGQRSSSRLLVLGEWWRGQKVASALDTLQQIEHLRHLLLSARVVLGVLSGLDKRRGPLQRLER